MLRVSVSRLLRTMSSASLPALLSPEQKITWEALQEYEAKRKSCGRKGKPSEEEIQSLRDHRQRKKSFLSSLTEEQREALSAGSSAKPQTNKPAANTNARAKAEAEENVLKEFAVKGSSLVDIGINLHSKLSFHALEQKLDQANLAGVGRVILTGCSLESSMKGREVCAAWYASEKRAVGWPRVYHTVGIHPHDAKTAYGEGGVDTGVIDQLREMADHAFVVSLGECGLDYDRMFSPMEAQQAVFEAQVSLAADLQKPLFVHLRERDVDKGEPLGAVEHTAAILRKFPSIDPSKVCVHCFTGDSADLKELTSAGYRIGLTGYIGMAKRAAKTGTLAAIQDVELIQLDQLLIETDSPYMKPDKTWFPDGSQLRRSKSNEPASMPAVCRAVAAEFHGGKYSAEEIVEHTTQNAERFFRFAAADELIHQLTQRQGEQ